MGKDSAGRLVKGMDHDVPKKELVPQETGNPNHPGPNNPPKALLSGPIPRFPSHDQLIGQAGQRDRKIVERNRWGNLSEFGKSFRVVPSGSDKRVSWASRTLKARPKKGLIESLKKMGCMVSLSNLRILGCRYSG